MNKRGISGVVLTVILVLLALTASGLLYIIIKPTITNTGEEIFLKNKCLLTKIKPISCIIAPNNVTLNVQYLKGEIDSIVGIIEFQNGEVKTARVPVPRLLETKEIIIIKNANQIPKIGSVSAIVKGEGKTLLCPFDYKISCSGLISFEGSENESSSDIPLYSLSITKQGAGDGFVTSNPSNIDCGVNCTALFNQNIIVDLTASPDAGSIFVSWNGACSGAGICTVTMNSAKSVIALFDSEPMLTYWGPNIDILNQEQWNIYLDTADQLKDIEFTHVGVHVWDKNPNSNSAINNLIKSRINDLRNNNFNIALHHSPGHKFLTNASEIDPLYHTSNGQNLKYFDSVGFNASICDLGIDCSENPERDALDPAYDGEVWQKELTLLKDLVELININSKDAVILDTEIWGGVLGWKRWYHFYLNNPDGGVYSNLLMNSISRYAGDRRQREVQFFDYWKQRGLDIKGKIKQYSINTIVLFYGENIPDPDEQIPFNERECINFRGYEIPSCLCSANDEKIICPIVSFDQTDQKEHNEIIYMPIGTGDAPSPVMYYAPNLNLFERELNKGDYAKTYVWISFSNTETANGYITKRWDPKITQKIGKMLRNKGVKGVIIYPGPYEPYSHNIPIDYFIDHAAALKNGFLNGIDPGALIEICNDGIDNDGDVFEDEGC